jgi:hypothetical protein
MITIGTKNKILLFEISTENIDSENLEFWFRIYCNEITYSFKGELVEDNKVKITVLPLTEIINPDYLNSGEVYHANLEAIGDGKYSLTTWEGDVQIETPPRIDVKLENVQEEKSKLIKNKNTKIITDSKKPEKIEVKMTDIIEENNKEDIKHKKSSKKSLLEDILYNPECTDVNSKIEEIL